MLQNEFRKIQRNTSPAMTTSNCPYCGESLYADVCDNPECRKKQEDELKEKKLITNRLSFESRETKIALGIPEKYHDANFTDSPPGKMVEEWFFRGKGLLTLSGTAGTGKTRMLYAVLGRAYCEAKPFRKYRVPGLLKELQALCGESVEKEFNLIKKLSESNGYLLLDDLGAEKTTQFTIQDLYLILSEREEWERPTLITTNLTISQIAMCLGERIASRIAGSTVLKFAGKDRRLDKKR